MEVEILSLLVLGIIELLAYVLQALLDNEQLLCMFRAEALPSLIDVTTSFLSFL